MSFNQIFERVRNPESWGEVVLPVPLDPFLWIAIGAFLLLLLLAIFAMRRWTRPLSHVLKLQDTGSGVGDDWNVVEIALSTAREILERDSIKLGDELTVGVQLRKRRAVARLRARKIAPGVLRLSERMAARLDVDFSSTDQGGPREIERPVRIWVPAVRVDLRTINSPDPSVKLQWRLGFLFLVLGVFLPRMVDSWL